MYGTGAVMSGSVVRPTVTAAARGRPSQLGGIDLDADGVRLLVGATHGGGLRQRPGEPAALAEVAAHERLDLLLRERHGSEHLDAVGPLEVAQQARDGAGATADRGHAAGGREVELVPLG